jgi:hypothetical protein
MHLSNKKKKKRSGQFNWHRKQNPSKKKKGPSSLTDTENKTPKKKKKKKSRQFKWHRKQKPQKKKKKKVRAI